MKQNENTLKLVLFRGIRKDVLLFGGKSWMSTAGARQVAVDEWSPLVTVHHDSPLPLYITEAHEWQQRKAAILSWANWDILGERIFQGAALCLTSVAWKMRWNCLLFLIIFTNKCLSESLLDLSPLWTFGHSQCCGISDVDRSALNMWRQDKERSRKKWTLLTTIAAFL